MDEGDLPAIAPTEEEDEGEEEQDGVGEGEMEEKVAEEVKHAKKLKVAELRAELDRRGISTSGP